MQLPRPAMSSARKAAVFAATVSSFLLVMLVPVPAHASILGDFLGIDDWLKNLFKDGANACFEGYFGMIQMCTTDNLITGSFDALFGSSQPYQIIEGVHQSVLIPLGESILALVMLVQVVKISQRIDANGTMPAVKEIVFLAVFYVIFHWLIVNSLDLCAAVFDTANNVTKAFGDPGAFNLGQAPTVSDDVVEQATVTDMLMMLISAALTWLAGLIAVIVTWVVAGARALQLYAFAVFSPIPFALLGFEETRSFGVSFCKNFIAVALAGAIIVFLLMIFPGIIASVVATDGVSASTGGIVNIGVIKTIAFSFLLVLGLVKSGAWAREIMGG